MNRAAAAGLLAVAVAAGGCLTPHARYTRSGTAAFPQPARAKKTASRDIAADHAPVTCADSGLKTIAESYLGTPYRRGGTSRAGMDCSGFVGTVFRRYNGTKLPRTTSAMKKTGRRIKLKDARCGDLVFFRTGWLGRTNHVGIWFGNGRFIHASFKAGVRWDNLRQEYYRRTFAFFRRPD